MGGAPLTAGAVRKIERTRLTDNPVPVNPIELIREEEERHHRVRYLIARSRDSRLGIHRASPDRQSRLGVLLRPSLAPTMKPITNAGHKRIPTARTVTH